MKESPSSQRPARPLRVRLQRFGRALRASIKQHPREFSVGLALVLVLALPFALRPSSRAFSGRPDARLIIITPHNETIRSEFGRAFAQHMFDQTGQRIEIDWRTPGGTSEIAMSLQSEFSAAFQNHWRRSGRSWNADASRFNDRSIALPDPEVPDSEWDASQLARREFLESNVGVNIDLFFGGGAYDFQVQAGAGHLVASDSDGNYGPAVLAIERPEWFDPEIIPESMSGEPFRDPDLRWIGVCLSSFGICYNTDVIERLGFGSMPQVGERALPYYPMADKAAPDAWEDLADPRFFRQIALADPTKSGSVTKAFEMLIQQRIRDTIDRTLMGEGYDPDLPPPSVEAAATPDARRRAERYHQLVDNSIREGWLDAMRLIQRISANGRYFTDEATKIPRDVTQGNAAAGMAIDFYGRTYNEQVRRPDGSSRVHYLTPLGGSSTGVDPIAMLRGAPSPDLAHAFIEFVLTTEGQKLWNYRVGTPGGPQRTALRRLPVRRDMYTPEHLQHMSDPEVMPYETADLFIYEPEWTARAFSAIRYIIRLMCIDTHAEQSAAWQALVEAGFPPRATAVFHDVSLVSYDNARGHISSTLSSSDKLQEVRLARDLANSFRQHYRMSIALARRNE